MEIAIIGASGHARVIIDIVEREGIHRIAGLFDRSLARGARVCGYEVIGTDDDAREWTGGLIVAIGDNWTRSRVVERTGQRTFVAAIHPSAQIARGVEIGEGSVIMAGVVVNTGARIGRHCILNTRCSLDHDSTLGDFASLGPNATTGGGVEIGEFAAVALSASILHGKRVGAHTVIGAGSTVTGDLRNNVVAYGTPARVIRGRAPGERYL